MNSRPGQRMGILFVDDEPKTCKYFRRLFAGEFSVFTAGGGEEALALLNEHGDEIGVLLSDQRMPVRSGVSLLGEVRERYPDVIRLITTAYSNLDDAVGAVNQGEVRRYISKPWDVELLRRELHDAMNLHLAQQRDRDLLNEKRQTMTALAAYVAHEMRTPLLSVRAAASGINRYLPLLLDAYDQARSEGKQIASIRGDHRRALGDAISSVERVVNRANAVIDMLLMNAGGKPIDRTQFKNYTIGACLDAVFADYPFTPGQQGRVRRLGKGDFAFHGSDTLMIYVLFNLLKNALYSVEEAGKGDITLSAQPGKRENRLYIKDTGAGIPEEVLPYVFDEFASFRPPGTGTGLGLSFSKRVLLSFDGDILCNSKEGAFTEFILVLPIVESGASRE